MANSIKPSWIEFKLKLVQLLGGLIMEKDPDLGVYVVSLGKSAFWCAFGLAMYIWIVGGGNNVKDISPAHLTILMSLLGYNLSKKFVSTVQSVWGTSTINASPAKISEEDGPG